MTLDTPESHEIELQELLDEHQQQDQYVEDSGSDLDEMREDEELDDIWTLFLGTTVMQMTFDFSYNKWQPHPKYKAKSARTSHIAVWERDLNR